MEIGELDLIYMYILMGMERYMMKVGNLIVLKMYIEHFLISADILDMATLEMSCILK